MVRRLLPVACAAAVGLLTPCTAFAPASSFVQRQSSNRSTNSRRTPAARRNASMSGSSGEHDILLRAARGENTDRAPVWLMRQAGRYMKDFRCTHTKGPLQQLQQQQCGRQ